ncbi:MAG TPA: universal stress protein, partial [Cryomorphaceae bacterium]|nr:universal stress protein [Cryomorphaceae bacterium]
MKKILIAVDNEDGTNEMLDYAAKMASLYEATLYILHIARPDPEFVGYDVGPEYIRLDAARN